MDYHEALSSRNAQIVVLLAGKWPEWEPEGIGPDEASITSAAAVGLVLEVWRNSPLEDMHAGGGMRGKGPRDPEMFAESVALHRRAVNALTSKDRFALLEFEDHVLNRARPWAVGGRTLQEMGYGYLGAFTKHVRGRTDALMSLEEGHGRRALLAYLVNRAVMFGSFHKGMPIWPAVVSTVCEMIADPRHEAWRDADQARKAMAAQPIEMPPVESLRRALLEAPDSLSLPVLEWLCRWRSGPMLDAISWARGT
ncbi:hypothetical protein ACOZ38_24805 [Sphaerisporangium viridialbum]|uniref:hypothetical protein n=1 Tax=Sphaerisporangium viridialbum TaxID=46189 RepID=UPI003C753562